MDRSDPSKPTLTTAFGRPVENNQNSLTAGPRGPMLMQDYHLIEKMAHFNRERVPERVVHAKGYGGHGTFTVTKDITQYTCADIFSQVGKKTEMFARFSTVGGENGSADTARDPRGFALKFYTEDGNWDLVGNNTPIFFIRDPLKFTDFIRTQKRDPGTHLKPHWRRWDYWSLSPEALHQVMFLYSDRGTPKSARFMNGYGSHTFSLWNATGERFWVKFHLKTQQGIQNFSDDEAAKLTGENPDYSTQDLIEAVKSGDYPKWTMFVQVMPEAEADTYKIHPFDLTKVWPHSDYPLIEVGVMELNRNVDNYFAEVEQATFEPSNVVPGIGFSPDKVLQNRVLSYADAHRYRLGGANYDQIPVNHAKNAKAHNYHRDGFMRGERQRRRGGRLRAELVRRPGREALDRRTAARDQRRRGALRVQVRRRGLLRPAPGVLGEGAGRYGQGAPGAEHRRLDVESVDGDRRSAPDPGADADALA